MNNSLGFYFPFNQDFSIMCYSYPINSPVDKMKYMDFVGDMTTIHGVLSTLNDVCKRFFYIKNNPMTGFELDCKHEESIDFEKTNDFKNDQYVMDLCKLKITTSKNRVTIFNDGVYNLQYRARGIIRRCDISCFIEKYYIMDGQEKFRYGGIFREFNSRNEDEYRIIRSDDILEFDFDHTKTTILDLLIKYIKEAYVTYEFLNWNWTDETIPEDNI